MPGYLTNRYISMMTATEADVAVVQSQVDLVEIDLASALADIEDLQLNVGV